jgi:hypothetical protein
LTALCTSVSSSVPLFTYAVRLLRTVGAEGAERLLRLIVPTRAGRAPARPRPTALLHD